MAKHGGFVFCYSFFILIFTTALVSKATDEEKKVYIVYMGSLPDSEVYSPLSHHHNILQKVLDKSSIANSLIRSYQRSFNGFAAKLTEHERQTISEMEEVVSVFPSITYRPQTTRSWDFMGFPLTARRRPTAESDIIIGSLDTGIWPHSNSFSDKGFGRPPKKWKGVCKGGKNFTCNNKVIGARFYSGPGGLIDDALDQQGHGTHTASTAAGNNVKGASFFGLFEGTARGAVPSSRIATYKVCDPVGCSSDNILAAFDDAIADGVDILTVSLGASSAVKLEEDSIAIGAFHGLKKGVLTVNSAGNSGPDAGTVSSVAPWMLSVAASDTDRKIVDKLVLGNGVALTGFSVNTFSPKVDALPLVHAKSVTTGCPPSQAGLCNTLSCFDKRNVKGKIVLCDLFDGTYLPNTIGALGTIYNGSGFADVSFVSPFSSLNLNPNDYQKALNYAESTGNARAKILRSEALKDPFAPKVADFSSRGPNLVVPDILKPDISAPGVNILAAYPPSVSPTDNFMDRRRGKYNIMSGTSMACPHVAGVAAYVKTFHPDWSPSAIKSSIMTTSLNMDDTSGRIFEHGSGHVNPVKAANPGLVYEIVERDYIDMLCAMGFNQSSLRLISVDRNVTCNRRKGSVRMSSPRDLNYPSMTANVRSGKSFSINFTRRVKNVGSANATYKANVFKSSGGIRVEVTPRVLSFQKVHEEKAFRVSVVGNGLDAFTVVSASLVWSDGKHSVRSPIVVYT